MKRVVIIAGPNGAGKTTFAQQFLPFEAGLPVFVNADLIAAGLSPFDPGAAAIRAGRMMLQEIDRHAAEGRSFAFETTLSGHTYLKRIADWCAYGYTVKLVFLSLRTPEEAIARVTMRIRQGGHGVAPDVVRRRFASGLQNFLEIYRHRVDYWQWIDNSRRRPIFLEEGELKSNLPDADMQAVPRALLRAARKAREIARATNTPIVIERDGVLVEEWVADVEDDETL